MGQEPKKRKERFVRALEEYDFKDEEHLLYAAKWVIYGILMFMELLVLLQHIEQFMRDKDVLNFVAFLIVACTLTITEAMKNFELSDDPNERLYQTLEGLCACGFVAFTAGSYSLIIYLLILTQFYLDFKDEKFGVWTLACAIMCFVVSYAVQVWQKWGTDYSIIEIFRESIGSLVAISLHFFSVQVLLVFYRQYLLLNKTLSELDENKRALEKAYEVLEEVTVLEERQRIAKEIHDTAGHSITTVIMQTEAAKRIIEKDPEDAKLKLAAANLQAKHALEELRDSVHLLSGRGAGTTLKADLEDVVQESMDGTDIHIRSVIEDIAVSEAKHRFICNTLKEGISNGIRHGGATAFWFELKKEDDNLVFLLSDNGKGLAGQPLKKGFGLTSMEERVKALGGEVEFTSEEDEGFEIRITMGI
jgi:signal transduction histidine kinase